MTKGQGWLGSRKVAKNVQSEKRSAGGSSDGEESPPPRPQKWSLGMLNDKETDEVPGSILLMSNAKRNEPLGLHNAPARRSASSLPSPYPPGSRASRARPSFRRRRSGNSVQEKKTTKDGTLILEPQPDDSLNDPLNWPSWRRDVALISLGFYCMLGGGMTPVLAAGFSSVSKTFNVSVPRVALTTGLYMMGLGLGSVVMSPTAILFGKRPVYLLGIVLFIISAIWCALSPNYPSLVIARIFMGFAVSPVECLPSATIAEIFYLHERAYRLGIYTLLLLSGKNLVPLVSAAIIESLGWRWVFWMVALVVGLCFALVFFFVPETFWDRTPHAHHKHKLHFDPRSLFHHHSHEAHGHAAGVTEPPTALIAEANQSAIAQRRQAKKHHHVGFTNDLAERGGEPTGSLHSVSGGQGELTAASDVAIHQNPEAQPGATQEGAVPGGLAFHENADRVTPKGEGPKTPALMNFNSPSYLENGLERPQQIGTDTTALERATTGVDTDEATMHAYPEKSPMGLQKYTSRLRNEPPKTYAQTLKPWNGRLTHDNWFRVAARPFILFAYPAILWSSLIYALSIGWLIVLSESITTIFENRHTYNFNALQAGLVYISPFIGGVLGTAVAGKFSDMVVRHMSRRNDGIYEPEFRLVMAIPIAIATSIGLMGYGWSVEERDNYMVPTVFFGIISFGCSLGSTTSITFAVDSYRQYAGEALVTMNFSKNIFHGLVFSLFFNRWLDASGPKNTFIAIGGIQVACLLTTIPMYIYGKRARMWTVRRNLMERF